jgi:hypothetical protein
MAKDARWKSFGVLGKLSLNLNTMRTIHTDISIPIHLRSMAERIEEQTLALDALLREHLGAKPK